MPRRAAPIRSMARASASPHTSRGDDRARSSSMRPMRKPRTQRNRSRAARRSAPPCGATARCRGSAALCRVGRPLGEFLGRARLRTPAGAPERRLRLRQQARPSVRAALRARWSLRSAVADRLFRMPVLQLPGASPRSQLADRCVEPVLHLAVDPLVQRVDLAHRGRHVETVARDGEARTTSAAEARSRPHAD